MEYSLKPCPFCGSSDLAVFDNAIICKQCDASGPDIGHCTGPKCRAETTKLWNARAASIEVREVEG
jgi:Zn finger protein HypA/HybF involved in hydrogenase expression